MIVSYVVKMNSIIIIMIIIFFPLNERVPTKQTSVIYTSGELNEHNGLRSIERWEAII